MLGRRGGAVERRRTWWSRRGGGVVEEVSRDFERKEMGGGGARSREVGSERPGENGWVGLRRPWSVGFQMTGQFCPG
jgi:hypothetical protein